MMRGFVTGALVLVLTIAAGVAWWAAQTPTYVHRFRIAIEIEADGANRVASSVIDVHTTNYKAGLGEARGLRSRVLGEAVFVDLGRNRNLVMTLGFAPYGARDLIDLLDFRAFRASNPKLHIEDLPRLTGQAPLTDGLIPILVTFADLNDPSTARVVHPHEFEQVFGPDVHFKRAWVEMTHDRVTRDIQNRLPWWNNRGRPAEVAYRAWLNGGTAGASIEPETLFRRL